MVLLVGQSLGLRRPLRPPRTGPGVVLRSGHEASCHWVAFDVALDPAEFLATADQVIITLVLPERPADAPEQQIGLFSGRGFKRADQLRDAHTWDEQEMDVVRHNHPRM